MKYKLAIFDLDGTILNTLDDLVYSTNLALTKSGLKALPPETIRAYLGNGNLRLIELCVGERQDLVQTVFADFKEIYASHSAVLTAPYPGIKDCIAAVRAVGIKTAVVSNKGDFAVGPLIEHYFPGLFDYAVGEKAGVKRKPAPDMVYACADALDTPLCDCIYIGDSEVDFATAKNAGLKCLSVLWGFRDKEELIPLGAGPFFDSPSALADYIVSGGCDR